MRTPFVASVETTQFIYAFNFGSGGCESATPDMADQKYAQDIPH